MATSTKGFNPVILFIVKFIAVYFLLLLAYNYYLSFYIPHNIPDPFSSWVGKCTAALANVFGLEATLANDKVAPWVWIYLSQKRTAYINEGCNAISIMIIFAAFIVAFSTTIKNTFSYILVGLIVILFMNVVRITMMSYIVRYHKEYTKPAHDYLFPAIIYGTIFLLWMIWVRYFVKRKTKANEQVDKV